jgi:hypothetical protein
MTDATPAADHAICRPPGAAIVGASQFKMEAFMLHPALPTRNLSDNAWFEGVARAPRPGVDLDSPARLVMTDLSDTTALTVDPGERLAGAERHMVQQGACVLFVVERTDVLGVLGLADLQGEKPLRLVFERGLRHRDLRVADVMQPVAQLDTLDERLLQRATVGEVVATLLRFGHPHLLVVEPGADPATPRVRGVVSQMQVERQLGMQLPSIEIAGTFAEIGRVLR